MMARELTRDAVKVPVISYESILFNLNFFPNEYLLFVISQ